MVHCDGLVARDEQASGAIAGIQEGDQDDLAGGQCQAPSRSRSSGFQHVVALG